MIEFARRRFVVVGDLQRTSRLELLRESNDPERRALMAAIAAEDVDFVAQLGDMVFLGDSMADWRHFDDLVRVLCVPLLPNGIVTDDAELLRRVLDGVHSRRFA